MHIVVTRQVILNLVEPFMLYSRNKGIETLTPQTLHGPQLRTTAQAGECPQGLGRIDETTLLQLPAGGTHDIDIAAGHNAFVYVYHGSVSIAAGATVEDASTVNGSITVGDKAQAASLETVNGAIRIGKDVQVRKDVETVNGSIFTDRGTTVGGGIETVNGAIGPSSTGATTPTITVSPTQTTTYTATVSTATQTCTGRTIWGCLTPALTPSFLGQSRASEPRLGLRNGRQD